MVILLSDRKSKCEKEIIEILTKYGAKHISDKHIGDGNSDFTILSIYKRSELNLKKGIIVFIDNGARFKDQIIPLGLIGICEENNLAGLNVLKDNKLETVCCGIGNKNSITLSSIGSVNLFACLQRSLHNFDGKTIEQGEFKIKLSKQYQPFSVMASTAILLLKGITPDEF